MILDKSLRFASVLDVFGAGGTDLVGDVIDLASADRRIGSNGNLCLNINISEDFAGGGRAQFSLVSSNLEAIPTDGSATVHSTTKSFTVAELVQGTNINIPLPSGIPPNDRYLGLLVTRAGGTTTAGAISAHLVLDAEDWAAMPDAVN